MKPPLFRLSPDLLGTYELEDVLDTAHAMHEMGLLKDPFDRYFIEVNGQFYDDFGEFIMQQTKYTKKTLSPRAKNDDDYVDRFIEEVEKDTNTKITLHFEYKVDETGALAIPYISNNRYKMMCLFDMANYAEGLDKSFFKIFDQRGHFIRMFLIVLLATKNIDKSVVKNKLSAVKTQERKDAKNFDTTITLKIGKITETYVSGGGGGHRVRPHFRRGHIRKQHFGKGNAEIKTIFIQPVFVNADQEWIDSQRTYRVVA